MGLWSKLFGTKRQPEIDSATRRVLASARVGYITSDFLHLTKGESARSMTEASWGACSDPLAMLCFLHGRASGRKFRLFALACARDELAHGAIPGSECPPEWLPLYQAQIESTEAYADGGPTPANDFPMHWVAYSVCDVITDEDIAHSALGFNADVGLWTTPIEEIVPEMIRRYQTHPVYYLRDIFGNPFRPVPFRPEWRTSTVLALARQMYEARDFGAMPILADALQDADCDNADLLDHCRGPGPHVRGCWVVDLVLDKE